MPWRSCSFRSATAPETVLNILQMSALQTLWHEKAPADCSAAESENVIDTPGLKAGLPGGAGDPATSTRLLFPTTFTPLRIGDKSNFFRTVDNSEWISARLVSRPTSTLLVARWQSSLCLTSSMETKTSVRSTRECSRIARSTSELLNSPLACRTSSMVSQAAARILDTACAGLCCFVHMSTNNSCLISCMDLFTDCRNFKPSSLTSMRRDASNRSWKV
mmetsp:Transcript_25442/g.49840  ORF Transcript_25442/g.49840 Transcript_25442/m.49840 type:complete len:219 (-) Transcript_25442:373-1029(-)